MKQLALALAAALLCTLPLRPAAAQSSPPAGGSSAEHSAPRTPVSVRGVLFATRFTLEIPYRSDWTAGKAQITRGTLVVLDVDPELVVPRDALEPVLYAGDVAVERLNHGQASGKVIGIVPGDLDLATVPIWFGAPNLPERVTAETIRAERARAEQAGVKALAPRRVAGLERPAVKVRDLATLLREVAAPLLEKYSPSEKDLADAWRLPEAGAEPRRR